MMDKIPCPASLTPTLSADTPQMQLYTPVQGVPLAGTARAHSHTCQPITLTPGHLFSPLLRAQCHSASLQGGLRPC